MTSEFSGHPFQWTQHQSRPFREKSVINFGNFAPIPSNKHSPFAESKLVQKQQYSHVFPSRHLVPPHRFLKATTLPLFGAKEDPIPLENHEVSAKTFKLINFFKTNEFSRSNLTIKYPLLPSLFAKIAKSFLRNRVDPNLGMKPTKIDSGAIFKEGVEQKEKTIIKLRTQNPRGRLLEGPNNSNELNGRPFSFEKDKKSSSSSGDEAPLWPGSLLVKRSYELQSVNYHSFNKHE